MLTGQEDQFNTARTLTQGQTTPTTQGVYMYSRDKCHETKAVTIEVGSSKEEF